MLTFVSFTSTGKNLLHKKYGPVFVDKCVADKFGIFHKKVVHTSFGTSRSTIEGKSKANLSPT